MSDLSEPRRSDGIRAPEGARTLVLASTSAARRELLGRLEVPFVACAPEFDERAEGPRFAELGAEGFALHLAEGKARSLVARYPDAWILGADQLAIVGGESPEDEPEKLLHKPGSEEAAIAQLLGLAGRSHRLVSGVVLLDARRGTCRRLVDHQRLRMRRLSVAEATAYVRAHRPLECVGAYRIEGPGIALFAAIESADFTGIIGLPLLGVARLLREVALLPGAPE